MTADDRERQMPAMPAGPPRPPRPRIAGIRPFTTRFVNPITRLVAGRLPGFAILEHRGRRSGRLHRAPMNVFRRDGMYLFALTYSSDVDWVKNVLAAGECEIVTRGRLVRLAEPELFVDPTRHLVRQPARLFLGLIRVTEFLRMRAAHRAPRPGERTRDC